MKNIWQALDDEIDQIWAEADLRYKLGEDINFMRSPEKEPARIEQEAPRERSTKERVIVAFLKRLIPED